MKGSFSMRKSLFTTDLLPEGTVVKETFGMVQFTGSVEISKKGFIRELFERNKNEYQNVIDSFVEATPSRANAILGVQISTSVQKFDKGVFMLVTYIGTPAIIN
jgi:uncharacterized protein YbjQ (UPF0145 family)